jgi:hypothetical protein
MKQGGSIEKVIATDTIEEINDRNVVPFLRV